jgi:hypothetical protein
MKQTPIPALRAPIVVTVVLHALEQNAEDAENALGRIMVLHDALKAIGYHGYSISTVIGGRSGLYVGGWDSVEVRISVMVFKSCKS